MCLRVYVRAYVRVHVRVCVCVLVFLSTRRLNTLNKSGSMKLDVAQPRKKVSVPPLPFSPRFMLGSAAVDGQMTSCSES